MKSEVIVECDPSPVHTRYLVLVDCVPEGELGRYHISLWFFCSDVEVQYDSHIICRIKQELCELTWAHLLLSTVRMSLIIALAMAAWKPCLSSCWKRRNGEISSLNHIPILQYCYWRHRLIWKYTHPSTFIRQRSVDMPPCCRYRVRPARLFPLSHHITVDLRLHGPPGSNRQL